MEAEIAKLTLPPNSDRDHIQGPPSAPVTLLEYGDYECPYCGQAYPIIKEVQKHLGNKLRFVFRNFPVTEIHSTCTARKLKRFKKKQATVSFGRCTIISMNISKHSMIGI